MSLIKEPVIKQAEQYYALKVQKELTTGNSGDRIFEGLSDGKFYILRMAKDSEAKRAHTSFELNWTEYLSAGMTGIAKPIRSQRNKLYEVITVENQSYIFYLQEKAAGKLIDQREAGEFNEDLFFKLGKLMGEMHKRTVAYPGNIINPQFEWDGPNIWRKDIVILDDAVRQSEERLIKALHQLPVNQDNYGIVHFDIHLENFLVDKSQLTLIDFDACQFNWYAADIASALFFMVQAGANPLENYSEKERTEFAENYLVSYMKGYLQSKSLSDDWLNKFDLFMKYQMIDEYIAVQNFWPAELSHQRQWYMTWLKDKLVNDRSFVEIDYQKLLGKLT